MRDRNRWITLAAAALVLVALLGMAGCAGGTGTSSSSPASSGGSSSGGSAAPATTIAEQNYSFSPSTLTVKVGDTVTFTNQDSVPHHVVVGTTDLGLQQPGATVTWTADKDGTYAVKCTIHPSMTGQITVGAGGPAVGGSAAPPAGGGTGSSGTGSSGNGY